LLAAIVIAAAVSHLGWVAVAAVAAVTAALAGVEHVVLGWPLAVDGRKHHAGAAVLASDGTVLAAARVLLIAPRES
jgi:hypothetical protein